MKDKMMDDDIENVGIMKGFMDSMDDEGDDEGSEDEETLMERRPDSPEILMNNLRGDMRSVDARRDELADLVGYKAAKETPDQVLAMLQPILAQQGGGGIGALPQSQPMAQGPQPPMMGAAPGAAPGGAPGAPPPGMPPMPPMPPMPEGGGAPPPPADGGIAALMAGMGGGAPGGGAPGGGMPPSDQPPVAMARGGYVQHFQTGSDESGVTPAGSQTATDDPLLSYPPELVQAAKDSASTLITQRPQAIPTLESRLQARLPEYQKLMGADKGAAQAQMLLELGQRAFGFAANTDEGGRPLRGSFISRLAGATKTLPSVMGRHIESMDKIDRQVKALALQQGEKDIDQVVSQNTELLKRKTDLFKEVLKANARLEAEKLKGLSSSIFGKGDWEWNLVNMPGMMDRYAKGETTDNETNLISSAITKLKTPRIETRLHPVTKVPFTVEIPGMPPQFVIDAENARKGLNLSVTPTPAMSGPGGGTVRLAPDGSIITPGTQRQPSAPAGGAPAAGMPAGGAPAAAAPMGGPGATAQGAAPARPPAGGSGTTLWGTRFDVAGPVGAAVAMGTSIPGLGDPAAANTLARKNAELLAERLKEAMLKSVAGSVWEQKNLDKVLAIRPSAMTDPDVYGTRLIALGQALREGIASYNAMGADNSNLAPEDKARAREKAMEYQKFLGQLGLPPAAYNQQQLESLYRQGYKEVLWNGVTPIKRD